MIASTNRLKGLSLRDLKKERGYSLRSLTVLDKQNDPFRQDTRAKQEEGQWLAKQISNLNLTHRRIHLRGLHYAICSVSSSHAILKPNGDPYTNTYDNWRWMMDRASKAARWLGYVPFEQVVDKRNDSPIIRRYKEPEPEGYLDIAGISAYIPGEFVPEVKLEDFRAVQPYRLAIFGEKSSLDEALTPIANRYQADLYLPAGEISATMVYQMAEAGAHDGRPVIVFCFSDADPSGYQMPISIARKLQGFQALRFPELEWEVVPAALKPEQVIEHDLTSKPLGDSEGRAEDWRARWGFEQVEIDSLIYRSDRLLDDFAHEIISPYFDADLDSRVSEVRNEWLNDAQREVDAVLEDETEWRNETEHRLDELRQEIDDLNAELEELTEGIELPELPEIPESQIEGGPADRVIAHGAQSIEEFIEVTRALKEYKAYVE